MIWGEWIQLTVKAPKEVEFWSANDAVELDSADITSKGRNKRGLMRLLKVVGQELLRRLSSELLDLVEFFNTPTVLYLNTLLGCCDYRLGSCTTCRVNLIQTG